MTQERRKDHTPQEWALSYLAVKPRTIREMELYLQGKHCGENEISEIVNRLKELGYLDDSAYARMFVESRLRTKPLSRRVLKEQLFKHHLPQECIEAALENISDERELEFVRAAAAKYWAQMQAVPDKERSVKMVKRLSAKGYHYDDIHKVIEELNDGSDDDGIDWTEE